MPAIPKIYIFTGQTRSKGLAVEVKQRLKEEKNIIDEVDVVVDSSTREQFLKSPYSQVNFWQNSKVLVLLNIQNVNKKLVLQMPIDEFSLPPELDKPWLILFNGMELDPHSRKKDVFADYRRLVESKVALGAMSFKQAVDVLVTRLIKSGAVQRPYEIAMHQV